MYNSTAISDGLDKCLGLLASMDASEKHTSGVKTPFPVMAPYCRG
jgi:hypothetical protein